MSAPDLSAITVRRLAQVFSSYPELAKVTLYGSRATGRAKPWSDIDLATHGIVGDRHRLGRLTFDLEDTSIPQRCDMVAYEEIKYAPLKRHVDNFGVVIYRRRSEERAEEVID